MAGLRLLEEYLNREFGELDIDIQDPNARANDIAAGVPQIRANAALNQDDSAMGLPEFSMSDRAAPEGNWNRTRQLGAGVVDLTEMAVGIPEYAAHQNKFLRPSVAPALEKLRGGIGKIREGILSGADPEYLEMVGREVMTLDPNKTIWQGGPIEVADAIYGKFLRSLPSTVAVMLPAARLFRAANTRGALTYLGASEGGLSLGAIQNNIVDEIAGMSNDDLLRESQRYAQIYDSVGGDEEKARQDFTAEAQGIAPVLGGVGVASISLAAGRLLKPVFEPGGLGLGRRVTQGFLAEAPQEGSQGATEQYVQNIAAQIYDANRRPSEGVLEAAGQEGLIGGLTGAAISGVAGERPPRPPTPLPAPEEGPGGQLGLPGIGVAQPQPPPPETPPPGPEGTYVPNTGMGLQTDLWPNPGTTEAAIVRPEQEQGQGVLPLGIAGTVPLAERGPGNRTLNRGNFPEQVPDSLDQPTAEPQVDIQAQIDDMKGPSGRSAVYLSPQQARTDRITLPKGAVVIPNFDGKGGRIIAKNQQAANYARQRRSEGGSMQAIIGELTLAGAGKPNVKSGYAVQLVGKDGAVARESLVGTKAEATALEKQWAPEGETRVLSGEEALARRSDLLEQEQIDLRTEDPAKVDEAVGDLFETVPVPLTAGENLSKPAGQLVRMTDDAGNVIVKETFDTPEEAEARIDELAKDFPDAILTSKPIRERAAPSKIGLTAASRAPRKVLKGPPEGPPPRPSSEVFTESTRSHNVNKTVGPIDEFNPDIAIKDIEDLPEFEVEYSVVVEVPQPNKSIALVERRETKTFSARKDAKSFATRKNNENAKKYPDLGTRESKIIEHDSPELESMFQSAVEAKAGRKQGLYFPKDREQGKPPTADEASSNEGELISTYRKKNRTVSQKVQFIRRERVAQQKRRAPIKDVRATPAITRKVGSKIVKADTKPLTYESQRADETAEQEKVRLAKVKEANTRLRFAVNRAKKFLDRFSTTGQFGIYVAENKNLDGSLTQQGRDFVRAREAFDQLVKLADSALLSGNKSSAHAAMAKKIAVALERIKLKSMTPEGFAKEFSEIARSTEYQELRTVPPKFRESVAERDRKVLKLNAERLSAAERKNLLENEWKNDKTWNEIIGPLFRKFSEQQLLGRYYNPTIHEIEDVRYALRSFRKMFLAYPTEKFYTPIKAQLEYYGFEFDEAGDVIVKSFSPSENLLGPKFLEQFGVSKAGAGEVTAEQVVTGQIVDPTPEQRDSVRILEEQEITDQRRAVRDITTANALLERFQSMTSPAKVTISGIKRQEQRFIRGLRKLGVWVDVSPTMGRISIGGYKSKTYRLVGPRLDAKTIQKTAAKEMIQRVAKIPMPRELATIASSMGGVSYTASEFVERNSLDMFLESTKPVENDADYREAAYSIGDILEAKGSVSLQEALTEIMKSAPVDSFYYQLADKFSTLGMVDTEVAYGVASDFGRGELGKFRTKDNLVLLNREAMNEAMLSGDQAFGARVMHVFTHEAAHAATHNAINKNANVARYFNALRTAAQLAWIKQGRGSFIYGLKTKSGEKVVPVDEFVVEAFSNPEFQDFLKTVKVGPDTVWGKIIEFIRNLLGITEAPNNLLEAVMVAEDILFEGSGVAGSQFAGDFNIEALDGTLRPIASGIINKAGQTFDLLKRVKERMNLSRFNPAAMNLMTMEQFVEVFGQYFKGALNKYANTFNLRNSSAAKYMQIPEKLSSKWTKLEQENPEVALKMSQVMSDATLNKEVADQGTGDIQNMFNSLPESAKALYREVREYYKNAVAKEQAFLLQAALRGITGINFTDAQLASVKEKADLRALLEEHVNEAEINDVLDTLYQMANVSTLKAGDYFPLMRYGNEVVVAEKQLPSEFFEDRKEAYARRKEIADSDPTLDVSFKETEDGRWEVRTFEREFVMAETRSEIEKAYEDLVARYGKENVKEPDIRRGRTVEAAINSNAQLRSILKTLEGNTAAQAAVKNFYLRSLSETSMRKHEMRRKNRRGVDRDSQHRNLATYARQASYYTAQLEHGWKMADALEEMDKFVSNYLETNTGVSKRNLRLAVQHLEKRDQMGVDLPEVSSLVRGGVEFTHFFMLTSPSYWMINATQPWMVSLPTMAAKFGYGQTLSAMKDISSLISPRLLKQATKTKLGLTTYKNRVLTEETFNVLEQVEDHIRENAPHRYDEYKGLLDDLRDRHIIDINVFTEMRERSAGKEKSTAGNVVDASRVMAHLTEINNRVLTALSAYQLAINGGMSVEEAKVYAGDMVSQTQFNYSSQNKPPLFQPGGPLGASAPLLFQFLQWPQHMYAHLIRNYKGMVAAGVMNKSEARSTLLGLLGTHAAVGGMVGMMLQPIKLAFGLVMLGFGDDDEPYTLANALSGATFDRAVASATNAAFGSGVSTIVSKGLPAGLLGIDLSARMSMGTIYYVDVRGDDPKSVLGSLVGSFGGATLNQTLMIGRGFQQVLGGDLLKGVETASPKMGRDILRAIRYSSEGLVNNAGDTVIDASEMSPYEVLTQFFGFQPTQISQHYSAQNAIKDAEQYAVGRRGDLLKQYREAETQAEKREVQREIADFNKSNPQERITSSALVQNLRAQKKRERRYRRYGANIDERKARYYERYGEPYFDE